MNTQNRRPLSPQAIEALEDANRHEEVPTKGINNSIFTKLEKEGLVNVQIVPTSDPASRSGFRKVMQITEAGRSFVNGKKAAKKEEAK